MRTALYLGKEKIKLTQADRPRVGPHDVLIKNINASICGTDVAVFQHGPGTGHKISVGEKFGHEMVSEVVEVGSENTDFKVGQRVYPYPVYAAGDPRKAGMLGGFTEYLLIKNAKLNHDLYLVPDELSNEVAAMTEPFTVATKAVKRTYPQEGESACVYGAGTIGLGAALALQHFDCKKVMVVDHSNYRLKIASKLDFETVNSAREDLKKKQLNFFGQGMSLQGTEPKVDIFIDAVGNSEILQNYLDSTIVDSRMVLVGVDNQIKEIDLLKMTFASQSLIGSGGYRPDDVETVFNIFRENKDNIGKMVTKVEPWENLVDAIKLASDPYRSLNVQVKY
ncbi:zinc-binding dehydrogenase [Lactobacillus sp.]|uniref:zinc-dependent alcohol dehydrogenase n=1 Tax=Lactobacillus sp. TaxID=1591 RepID=UPI00345E1027